MYKNIKALTSKPVPRPNVLKDENGTILTEVEEIKSRWKQYCEKLYASQEDNAEEEDGVESEDTDSEPEILLSEVNQAMKRFKNGKSPGIDNIQAELLKESEGEGVAIIHRLCNKIWHSKEWPEDWKRLYSYLYQRRETQGNVLTTAPSP
ncbi:uncharacterized protein [Amphiura filiformis]|uniref:uncharacterized protein n=1 Tax=Amphiura filiformis TaxID=82378 RepID=UPI003B21B672